MPHLLVYGKVKTLSKLQLKEWARFALWEKDVVLFAFPVILIMLLLVLQRFMTIDVESWTHQPTFFIGILIVLLYGFIRKLRTLNAMLTFQQSQPLLPLWWPRLIAKLAPAWGHSKRIYCARSFHMIPALLCPALLWPILSGLFGELSTLTLIAWIQFEIVLRGWRARRDMGWLDLTVFPSAHALVTTALSVAVQTGLMIGIVAWICGVSLFHVSHLAFGPILAMYMCFFSGLELAFYSRIVFAGAYVAAVLLTRSHPSLWIVVIWMMAHQLESVRRQVTLSFHADQFRVSR